MTATKVRLTVRVAMGRAYYSYKITLMGSCEEMFEYSPPYGHLCSAIIACPGVVPLEVFYCLYQREGYLPDDLPVESPQAVGSC